MTNYDGNRSSNTIFPVTVPFTVDPPSGAFLIRASAGGVRGLGLGRPSDASWFPAFIACLLAS